jgi:hypothetical protein
MDSSIPVKEKLVSSPMPSHGNRTIPHTTLPLTRCNAFYMSRPPYVAFRHILLLSRTSSKLDDDSLPPVRTAQSIYWQLHFCLVHPQVWETAMPRWHATTSMQWPLPPVRREQQSGALSTLSMGCPAVAPSWGTGTCCVVRWGWRSGWPSRQCRGAHRTWDSARVWDAQPNF